MVANVVGGGNGHASAFLDGHAGAIDPGAITRARESIGPGSEVRVIFWRQSAAFLDIQKNYRAMGKAFLLGHTYGACRISGSPTYSLRGRFEFSTLRAVKKNQKPKFFREHALALAKPGVLFCSWRSVEPVAAEGECFSQNGERGVTGISIEIETEIRLIGRKGLLREDFGRRTQAQRTCRDAEQQK